MHSVEFKMQIAHSN